MIRIFLALLFIAGCSKAPLFRGEGDNPVDRRRAADSFRRLGGFNLELEWLEGPRSNGESRAKLSFWNPQTSTVYGPLELPKQKLCALLWMKMPDGSEHGSAPVTVKTQRTSEGKLFLLGDIYFVMNGLWQLRLRLVETNVECKATKDFPYLEEEIVEVLVD